MNAFVHRARLDDDDVPLLNEADPFTPILRALVDHLQLVDNVMTEFRPMWIADAGGGYFAPPNQGEFSRPLPLIVVHRESQQHPGSALEEAMVLAHEAGHFDSWHLGQRGRAYEAALAAHHVNTARLRARWLPRVTQLPGRLGRRCRLPLRHAREVYLEECRAWRNGRMRLATFGFTHWEAYDQRTLQGLASYVRAFGRGWREFEGMKA